MGISWLESQGSRRVFKESLVVCIPKNISSFVCIRLISRGVGVGGYFLTPAECRADRANQNISKYRIFGWSKGVAVGESMRVASRKRTQKTLAEGEVYIFPHVFLVHVLATALYMKDTPNPASLSRSSFSLPRNTTCPAS